MTITIKQIEEILNTLPIGYYAKRKINLKLDENAQGSFYDPMNDEITISYPQLANTIDSLDEQALEDDIRCMLYHEISHAILTPKNLKILTYINIIEDERIETILSDYYLRVNFREFVKKVNHYHGEQPKNVDEAFYHLVRFRQGTDYWLNRLKDLIKKYNRLSQKSYWDTNGIYDYSQDCYNFYHDFIDDWERQKQQEQKQEQKQEQDQNQEQISDSPTNSSDDSDDPNESQKQSEEQKEENTETSTDKSQQTTEGEDNTSLETPLSTPAHGKEPNPEFDKELADELFEAQINKLNNKQFSEKIHTILNRISKNNKHNGSAINSYSGKFDIRSVTRDDYKYFVSQNRNGHVNAYSKTNLNLFVDCSGSFSSSEKKVNELVYALIQFEKANPDFNLNIITMNEKIKILEKKNRTIKCVGGNRLTPDLPEIYKKLQFPGTANYNIALWDGDANSDYVGPFKTEGKRRFSTFNHENCTIISDTDNERDITRYCKSAKKIFTSDYTNKFEENIFKTLQALTR